MCHRVLWFYIKKNGGRGVSYILDLIVLQIVNTTSRVLIIFLTMYVLLIAHHNNFGYSKYFNFLLRVNNLSFVLYSF